WSDIPNSTSAAAGRDKSRRPPNGGTARLNLRIASGSPHYFTARTVSTVIVPLPTNPSADAVPFWTLVELEIRACRETVWLPTETLLATKLNDAAFSVERISSIVSGVTQF